MKNEKGITKQGYIALLIWNIVMFGIGFMAQNGLEGALYMILGSWFGVIFWYTFHMHEWLFPKEK